ncbi:uncharacterized protein BDR25DRAFT_300235 [Lindgomyces ingoldianus]|uniref:Uncharacterized protein n=1 Tax=Lindgomyces ingoldianus TaxID=673940 RepID=A0ACB6RD70_9PLEO|nr:uncharacterized protein BDR25DRAFT_300235 [Lindgomyces ingoldianus]KAF2477223.1 hypothetical protein BDR25DRAFT_300235 [Lindgomyces ingoldianus]
MVPYAPALSSSERQYRIDHSGRIHKPAFTVVAGVFFALATLLTLSRCLLRLHLRRTIFLDDILVIFGACCLAVATGVLYYCVDDLFLLEAFTFDPLVAATATPADTIALVSTTKWTYIFVDFTWTAIFAVKFSFLVFFKTLITGVSRRLNWYFWGVVGVTAVTWGFEFVEPFVYCPHFGMDAAVKCSGETQYIRHVTLTSIVIALDIITDLLIVSIPITILNMTQLKRSQKAGIAVFLCLSTVMIVMALIRIAGIQPAKRQLDTNWGTFWLHFEGCIAICMGSITAFRGIFASHSSSSNNRTPDGEKSLGNEGSFLDRLLLRIGLSRKSKTKTTHPSWLHATGDIERNSGPRIQDDSITHATMRGLKTFIRRHGREPGNNTTLGSVHSEFDPLAEYHDFQRHGQSGSKEGSGRVGSVREWNSMSEKGRGGSSGDGRGV